MSETITARNETAVWIEETKAKVAKEIREGGTGDDPSKHPHSVRASDGRTVGLDQT